MTNEDTNKQANRAPSTGQPEGYAEEDAPEHTDKGTWREAFVAAFQKARRQQKPVESRRELGRDKSKSLILLVGFAIALLLVFFGVFSHPRKKFSLPGENAHGAASLGRRVTPGQENNDSSKAVTPMLSADVRSTESGPDGELTPEDIGRTSRTGMTPKPSVASNPSRTSPPQDYALGKVDFSDPVVGAGTTTPNSAPTSRTDSNADLKKPSLVFIRSAESKPMLKPNVPENAEEQLSLPAGTRLVARLQTPVSSAVSTPVLAVVEYNYELNGTVVLPAGAKVLGKLTQASPSGYVGIQFNRIEMPDGSAEKIDASAMSLDYGPLKGTVSGKKAGTKFLIRSLTGLGTIASYVVGPQGSASGELISPNTLMRERLADNVATAGQEELNGLAFNQNVVVTLPGNTRFYIVVQKSSPEHVDTNSDRHSAGINTADSSGGVPSLEELRQLMQLRSEINQLYTQANAQSSIQPQPQQ